MICFTYEYKARKKDKIMDEKSIINTLGKEARDRQMKKLWSISIK